jgi:hypothetical protein
VYKYGLGFFRRLLHKRKRRSKAAISAAMYIKTINQKRGREIGG